MRQIAKIAIMIALSLAAQAQSIATTVIMSVSDESGNRLPCRIHIQNERGQAQRAVELPFWKDYFVSPGQAKLQIVPGTYTYQIERGPEYQPKTGRIDVLPDSETITVSVSLHRRIDMTSKGWWSGELHVHRAIAEMPLHMQAEDLHWASVISWWNGHASSAKRPTGSGARRGPRATGRARARSSGRGNMATAATWRQYGPGGRLRAESRWRDVKAHGQARLWDGSGKLVSEKSFKDARLVP